MHLFNNNDIFFSFATHFKSTSSTTRRELRLVVDEDDYGKFRLKKFADDVQTLTAFITLKTCVQLD